MTAYLYLHEAAFTFVNAHDLVERLNTFIQTKLYAKGHGDETVRHESLYNIETPLGLLYELMYNSGVLPGDVQQVLIQAIDQNSPASDQCETVEDLGIVYEDQHAGFLGFDFSDLSESEERCVSDKPSWYHFHRQYFVEYPPDARDMTCSEQGDFGYYFPHLHLCPDNVPASLRTLHDDHKKLMKTIIHHLSALNDFFYPEFTKGGRGADVVCGELENHYRSHEVKIGASRDSGGKKDLEFTFTDIKTIKDKTCYCDLHTKFYQFYEVPNPSKKQRSDRMYFHQPIKGFIDEKVLIAHIGKHL